MRRAIAVLAAGIVLVALVGCEPKASVTAKPDTTPAKCQHSFQVVGTVTPATATPRAVLQRMVGGKWVDAVVKAPDTDPHVSDGPVSQTTGKFSLMWFVWDSTPLQLRVRSDSGQNVSPSFIEPITSC